MERISEPAGPNRIPDEIVAIRLTMCWRVRIGGVWSSGRSSCASSSAARYSSTQVFSSAASASSGGGAPTALRIALRRSLALAVCSATYSARVIVVAAAYMWKRNGMNGITHSSGTASFLLYSSMNGSWSIAVPSPGAISSALSLTASHHCSRPAAPSFSSSSSSGKCTAIFARNCSKAFSCISFRPG